MSPARGVLGQYAEAERAVEAARALRAAGTWRLDAHTPFAVEGMAEAIGGPPDPMAAVVLCGGLAGGIGGFLLQYWSAVVSMPLNVGGRPLDSWPSFIPVTFELTVLFASLSAVFGLLALSGLPRPHHPLFAVDAFRRASRDKFFLHASGGEDFDAAEVRALMKAAGAEEVFDVAE